MKGKLLFSFFIAFFTGFANYAQDTTPPVISNITMSSNNSNTAYAKEGDVITLSFESNEAINTPTVIIAGESATVSNPSGNNWTATITVGATSTEGAVAFLIGNISDIANNSSGSGYTVLSSGNATIIDRTAPAGYGIQQITNPVSISNQTQIIFVASGSVKDDIVSWTITDSGNNTVTGAGIAPSNGLISSPGIDVSSLNDGTLTVSYTYTDPAGNIGLPVSGTTTKDTVVPVISNITMSSNNANSGFAKVGDVITLSFESNEAINTPTVVIAGESATVSNPSGNNWTATITVGNTTNEGAVAFLIGNISDIANNSSGSGYTVLSSGNATVIDRTAPTGYAIANLTDPVIPSNVATTSFDISGLEANVTYNWSISDGSNPDVTGNGTSVGGGTESITNVDVSSLDDGTLTVTVYSTDQAGNQGANTTATTTKDTQGPVIVLNGDNPQTLQLNHIYIEQGVTSVTDNIDGVLDPNNVNINTSALDNTTVGRYNIVYTIDDSRGNTGTAIRVVHVMDTKPTVENDAVTVLKNSTDNAINVLANDCFGTNGPNTGHSLTLINGKTTAGTTEGGLIFVNNNGTPANYLDDYVVYTPKAEFSGTDSFTYTITDTNGIAATATVTITVSNVNANGYLPDTFTVLQDSNNNELDVMANDSDDAGFGPLDTRFLIESVNHLTGSTEYDGVVTLNTKGTADTSDDVINYTPKTGFSGTDTFRYVPGNNRNDYVLVTVTVTSVAPPANGTPTAVDDTVSVVQGSSNVTIDVLNNDTAGSDGYINDGLRLTNGTFSGASTQGGTISINTNGTVDTTDDVFVYTAPANTSITSDSFEYTITDASGDADTGEVTITISAPNTITVIDDTFNVVTDSSNNTLDIFANDIGVRDANGAPLVTITSINYGATSNGSYAQTDGGVASFNDDYITYTPTLGFTGQTQFTYTVNFAGGSSTGTVTINVTAAPPTTTPTAVDDTFTVNQGSTNNLLHVLDNDSYGADGANATHPLTFSNGSVVNASANGGAVSIVDDAGTNKISYTPVSGFSGTDTITYVITDDTGDAASATVTITVTSAASLLATPTAVNDTATTDVDVAASISVLANDTFGTDGRAGANHLTVGANSTQGGTTVVNGDEIDFTPANGFNGIDTFTYTIEDGNGDQSTATVTVTVGTPVTTPTAVDDTASVGIGSSVTIDVLANDSSGSDGYIDGGLTFTNGTLTSASLKGGAIAVNNKGTLSTSDDDITYSPFKGAIAGDTDSFQYTITDATGDASTATVTINITAAATDVPTASDDTASTTENVAVTVSVLTNDTFGTDGRAAANHLTTGANSTQGGTTVVSGDDIIYTPATSFIGIDTFTYTIEDLNGDTSSATVTVTVSHTVVVNGTPTAVDDNYGENDGFDRYNWTSADPVIYLDVLANDSFGSDGAMTAHNALNLINGKIDEFSTAGRRIRIDNNGTPLDYSDDRIAYYATGNTSVTSDTFTYTITDNSGDAATATVRIDYFDTPTPKEGDSTDTNFTTNNSLTVANEFISYPNPSTGNLTTTVFSIKTTKAILSLYDVRGMEVVRKQIDLKAGKNVIENNFNVRAGVMFLKVYNADTNYGIKKIVFK